MRFNIRSTTSTAVLAITLASGLARPTSATQFAWLDDPNSTTDFSGVSISCGTPTLGACGNSITVTGIEAVNGPTAQADIGLFLPFIWPRDESQSPPQQFVAWSNSLGGWYNADFDSLGTSLLVQVDITGFGANTTVLAGGVADGTGQALFGPTSDSFGIPWPNETLAATDALPFVDLGSFAPNESKTFGFVFTYTFGDGRSCDLITISCRTSTFAQTLVPDTAVPEPSTWALMLLGLGGLGLLARKRLNLTFNVAAPE